MKVLVVLSALVAFAAAVALTKTELELLQAFPYLNLMADDEQRNIIFNCLLGKCESGAYKQVAELSLRVMVNECAECSPAQKINYDNILKGVHDKYEPFYNELMEKVRKAKKERSNKNITGI